MSDFGLRRRSWCLVRVDWGYICLEGEEVRTRGERASILLALMAVVWDLSELGAAMQLLMTPLMDSSREEELLTGNYKESKVRACPESNL